MLLSKNWSVGRRVAVVLAATAAAGLLPLAAVRLGWMPRVAPSSPTGVFLGLLGAAIIFFEMALYLRKKFRRFKGWPAALFRIKLWLWLHVVLGVAVLPIILVHGAYGLGGLVPAATMVLFLLTIASGVWGLVLQQWLPQTLIDEAPDETVASQADRVGASYVGRETATGRDRTGEVYRILEALTLEGAEPGEVLPVPGGGAVVAARPEALVRGAPADQLAAFCAAALVPYLEKGRASGSPLASAYESGRRFGLLRETLPSEAQSAVDRLEELARYRREWDFQGRLNSWLHAWVPVHLGLSAAMTGLMVIHAVRALKYW